eukprot:TRINITY_DN35660_c0_g1_i2.p1 TRINITY_DN35660_c0_g1~~TRINITY_DN35660_c0_g1_i2.p1  ORF type:complete len:335 (-),score=74.18 TRINITY_DN35660_c0_g1_i2:60-1031(-)
MRIETANAKLEQERREKLRELQELKKKKNQQLDNDLNKIIKAREKAKQEEEEQKMLEKEKESKHKRIISQRIEQEKKKREETKLQKQELANFLKREDLLAVIISHRKQLKHVFQFFCRSDNLEISHQLSQSINTLDLSKFSKFCVCFRIIPYLMPPEEAVNIYKQAIKSKIIKSKEEGKEIVKETQLITYSDFEELLIRLGLVLRHKLSDTSTIIRDADLNKAYDISEVDSRIVSNLVHYLDISPEDTNITLDRKLNKFIVESKKSHAGFRRNITQKTSNKLPLKMPSRIGSKSINESLGRAPSPFVPVSASEDYKDQEENRD